MKKTLIKGLALAVLGAALTATSAMATTVTVSDSDEMIYFPGYQNTAYNTQDVISRPQVYGMTVTFDSLSLLLETVTVHVENRLTFDTLFINTNWAGPTNMTDWHSWEYMVRSKEHLNSDLHGIPSNVNPGTYSVSSGYEYELVYTPEIDREDHPYGIEEEYLEEYSAMVPTYNFSTKILTYDFRTLGIKLNGPWFNIAYSPYCANDVDSISHPVPEPSTMLLLGTGLAGLVGAARRRAAKKA